jgi:hypothetical protein
MEEWNARAEGETRTAREKLPKGCALDEVSRLATSLYSGHPKVGEIVGMSVTRHFVPGALVAVELEEDFSLSLSHCAADGGKASSTVRALHDHFVLMCAFSGMHSRQHAEESAREGEDAVESGPWFSLFHDALSPRKSPCMVCSTPILSSRLSGEGKSWREAEKPFLPSWELFWNSRRECNNALTPINSVTCRGPCKNIVHQTNKGSSDVLRSPGRDRKKLRTGVAFRVSFPLFILGSRR